MRVHCKYFIMGFCLTAMAGQSIAQSYGDLGVTREDARRQIAEALFDQPASQLFYSYNRWRASSNLGVSESTALASRTRYCSHAAKGGHAGLDIQTQNAAGGRTPPNETFYALDSGTVIQAGGALGQVVVYNRFTDRSTVYLHAWTVLVDVGDDIEVGDELGIQGDVGAPVGNEHVHVEVVVGELTGAACGADSPARADRIIVDPVDYLYRRINEAAEIGDERAARKSAAKIVPPMISSSSSCLEDNRFELDFTFDTYADPADIRLSANFYYHNESRGRPRQTARVSIEPSEVDLVGDTEFGIQGEIRQKRYRVRKSVTLLENDADDLRDGALVRVFFSNRGLYMSIPRYRGMVRWEDLNFSMFVPGLRDDDLGDGNSSYTRGAATDSQRYIDVEANSCR